MTPAEAARPLARAAVDAPRRTAELLLAHVAGCGRAALLADPPTLTPGQDARFQDLLRRREAREPLEYLVGEADFAGIRLACDRRALIPRPETEDLVEMAVKRLAGIPAPRVADLGTGTGAIALALKARLPQAQVVATDASPDALTLAGENARRLGLQVDFRLGRDLEPLDRTFDLILANPPYITNGEFPGLMPEVQDWEPKAALVSGPEGTEILARWIAAAPRFLKPGGDLAVEMGATQAARVETLFSAAGFSGIATTPDFAGLPRFVSGNLPR